MSTLTQPKALPAIDFSYTRQFIDFWRESMGYPATIDIEVTTNPSIWWDGQEWMVGIGFIANEVKQTCFMSAELLGRLTSDFDYQSEESEYDEF